jgi:hypothetical protein
MAYQAGQLIGYGIGHALGGQVGAFIGTTVMSWILPPDPIVVEGPKLEDLRLMRAGVGKPIPLVFGQARIAGTIIAANSLREVREEQTSGKGATPKQKNITYKYFGTFAVALCEGPILGIRRVWADGDLVVDASGDGPLVTETAETYTGGLLMGDMSSLAVENPSLSSSVVAHMRVYPGDEGQLPDPTLETFLGAGNVPAHRGVAYVVFDDLPLDKWGNRVPNLEFEVVTPGPAQTAPTPAPQLLAMPADTPGEITGRWIAALAGESVAKRAVLPVPGDAATMTHSPLLLDRHRNQAMRFAIAQDSATLYAVRQDQNGPQATEISNPEGLVVRELIQPPPLRNGTLPPPVLQGLGPTLPACYEPTTGMAWVAVGSRLVQINTVTNTVVASESAPPAVVALQRVNGATEIVSSPSGLLVVNGSTAIPGLGGNPFTQAAQIVFVAGRRRVYVPQYESGEYSLFGAEQNEDGTWTPLTGLPSVSVTSQLTDASLVLVKSPAGQLHAVLGSSSTGTRIKRLNASGTWSTVGQTNFASAPMSASFSRTGSHLVIANRIGGAGQIGTFDVLRTADWSMVAGAPILTEEERALGEDYGLANGLYNGSALPWDRQSINLVIADRRASWGFGALSLPELPHATDSGTDSGGAPGTGPHTVGSIFKALASKVEVGPELLDTAQAEDPEFEVQGFVVGNRTNVRTAFEPLMSAYAVDVRESVGRVTLAPRSKAVLAADIPLEDQCASSPGESTRFTEYTRAMEQELPQRVELGFSNPALAYQADMRDARRGQTISQSSRNVTMPIVMTADKAKAVAELILATSWMSRSGVRLSVSRKYAHLEPGDMVRVQTETLNWRTVIINRVAMSPGGVIQIEASDYDRTVAGGAMLPALGSVQGAGAIASELHPVLVPLALPLLRAVDDRPGFYAAAYPPEGGSTSTLAVIVRMEDGQALELSGIGSAATAGRVLSHTPPASAVAPLTLAGPELTFTVELDSGDLFNATSEADALAGATTLVAYEYAPQAWALASYLSATPGTGRTFTLSGIVVGHKGTHGHPDTGVPPLGYLPPMENARIVLLNSALVRVELDPELADDTLQIKAVAMGQAVDGAQAVSFSQGLEAQRPLAPSGLTLSAVAGDANSRLLSWTMTPRVPGEVAVQGTPRVGVWTPAARPGGTPGAWEIRITPPSGPVQVYETDASSMTVPVGGWTPGQEYTLQVRQVSSRYPALAGRAAVIRASLPAV